MAAAQEPPVWRYYFTHTAPDDYGGDLGAFHGLELVYLFQVIERLLGGSLVTPDDEEVAAAMLGYWTRFATTGDPNGGDAPAWPEVDAETDAYLEIAAPPLASSDLRDEYCDFWDRLGLW